MRTARRRRRHSSAPHRASRNSRSSPSTRPARYASANPPAFAQKGVGSEAVLCSGADVLTHSELSENCKRSTKTFALIPTLSLSLMLHAVIIHSSVHLLTARALAHDQNDVHMSISVVREADLQYGDVNTGVEFLSGRACSCLCFELGVHAFISPTARYGVIKRVGCRPSRRLKFVSERKIRCRFVSFPVFVLTV